MIRKIIKIEQEKCNGCGLCADACHEGAIVMEGGKAKLMRDDYCDGLGDCLPVCPTGAISFEEREAAKYDEAAVKARLAKNAETLLGECSCSNQTHNAEKEEPLACGCPGTHSKIINRKKEEIAPELNSIKPDVPGQLSQWPVQIKLVPVNAPYFENAHLLVAADCTAFAYGNFHADFIKNRTTLIGCPKLDEGDYSEKLAEILKNNSIKSVTVVRIEVPCCGGIESAVKKALQNSGKMIPWQVVTISADGRIIEN